VPIVTDDKRRCRSKQKRDIHERGRDPFHDDGIIFLSWYYNIREKMELIGFGGEKTTLVKT